MTPRPRIRTFDIRERTARAHAPRPVPLSALARARVTTRTILHAALLVGAEVVTTAGAVLLGYALMRWATR